MTDTLEARDQTRQELSKCRQLRGPDRAQTDRQTMVFPLGVRGPDTSRAMHRKNASAIIEAETKRVNGCLTS